MDNSVYDSPPAWMVWRSLKETPASSKTDESPDAEQIMVSWYEWVPTVYIEENIRFQQQHSPRKLDENVVIQYENQLEIDEVFARSPVRRFTCREPEVSGYDRTLTFYEGSCSFYSIDRRADYHGGAGNYTEKLSVIDERDVVGTDETPAYPPSWTGYVGMYYRDVDGIYTDDSGLIPVINPSPQYFPKPGGIATDIRGVAEYPNFNWRFSNDLEWGGGSVFLLGYGDVWNSATEEDDSTLFLGSFSNNKSHSVQLDERITDPQGLAITQHRTFSIFKNQHPTTFYVLDASEPRLYHHTGWRGNSEWEYVDLPTDRTYRGVTAIRAGDDFDDDVIYLLTDTHIEERTRPDFALTRIVLPPSGSQNLKDLDSRPYQVYELDLDKDNWQANFEEHSSPVLSISEGVLVLYLMAENSEGVTKLYRATLPFMESTKEIEP
ncbi:MAG: hypothetical protein F4Y63_00035 [Chloroflexi bacterium]|nr:hypothetical protein [Chloroflexota bacterium]